MFDDIRDTFPKQLTEVAAFERNETRDALAKARSVDPNYASHININSSSSVTKYESYYNTDDIEM